LYGLEYNLPNVLSIISKNKLIYITGPEKIGKSSLAKLIAELAIDNQFNKDGIVYLDICNYKSLKSVTNALKDKLENFLTDYGQRSDHFGGNALESRSVYSQMSDDDYS
jgi:predicted AAA+ superfamily ATPase